MNSYSKSDLLRLAKRHHNTKRTYLLVDPLQGKHIPVSPTESLRMLEDLGRKVHEQYPVVDIVIGFAETATAVGAVVASAQSSPCLYVHTTREAFALTGRVIEFQEEHSHATEQNLCMDKLIKAVEAADTIAFVDDELSTGKTLLNVIDKLREELPTIRAKQIVAVSIINRLTPERVQLLAHEGVKCVSLLHLELEDYTEAVKHFAIEEATPAAAATPDFSELAITAVTDDPRHGVVIDDYIRQCKACAEMVIHTLNLQLKGKRLLVLGTEEYMLPGLLLGKALEQRGANVRFHATTRSPIGICQDKDYPIQCGVKLHSLYETARVTYLYQLDAYDAVLVVTDTPDDDAYERGRCDLAAALRQSGCEQIIFVRERKHVQHLFV